MRIRALSTAAALLSTTLPAAAQTVIVDGDTLRLGHQLVRLYGIDAPERDQTCDGGRWPAGKLSTAALDEIIGGRPVMCAQVDWDGRNKRPVSRCSSVAGGADLSKLMVERGMAWAFVRYSTAFVEAERRAASAGAGVHGHKCVPAWEWRAWRRNGGHDDE